MARKARTKSARSRKQPKKKPPKKKGAARNTPPIAKPQPVERSVHGERLVDDYAWLRAANWREVMRDPSVLDPQIRAYLDAENRYSKKAFAKTAGLRKRLIAEMRGRIKEDDSTVPARDGSFAYFVRYREGGQHPLAYRVPAAGGSEELLLDGDALAKGKAYFHLAEARHSRDHRLLAWSADDAGSEFNTIHLRDIASRKDLADLIPDSTGAVMWTADSRRFFYVRLDAEHRPSRVFLHRLGTPVESDTLIYEEHDKGFFVSIGQLQAGVFGAISCGDHETSETWLADLSDPTAPLRLVEPRQKGVRYSVEHHPAFEGRPALIILTNADDAEDFKIVTAPLDAPGRAHWRDLVAHRPGTLILDVAVLRDWLVRLERAEGLPRIVVRRLSDRDEHTIAFDEEAYSLGMSAGFEFVTDTLRFSYSSMTTPTEVWDYDMAARTRILRKRQEVPSGHDPAQYVTRHLQAKAPDGELIPISLLYRRGLKLDGKAPCLLFGYGAYGIAMPASFNTNRLSLVDRGFIVAIAHIRGGTEKGWRWYREGKLAKKQNTFSDFAAAAEYLIRERFTSADRIVAQGGSAGGLLMGAVANQRPELFKAIIAEVPFVDALNTILDDTLPLTPPEWPEWGNPIESADAFRWIRAYSPYDNVRAQDYPAILVLAGLTDPRVTYWEPAKWTAKLRALKTDKNPLFLRTNMDAGHGGAAGRFDRLEEVALVYAFALETTGLA
ncbi:MAG TPA: S9 family peptidase [Xanthobacteraceae bacterium]|nr:S9 family peptidase [Xanthobacteraceae bacterium]